MNKNLRIIIITLVLLSTMLVVFFLSPPPIPPTKKIELNKVQKEIVFPKKVLLKTKKKLEKKTKPTIKKETPVILIDINKSIIIDEGYIRYKNKYKSLSHSELETHNLSKDYEKLINFEKAKRMKKNNPYAKNDEWDVDYSVKFEDAPIIEIVPKDLEPLESLKGTFIFQKSF